MKNKLLILGMLLLPVLAQSQIKFDGSNSLYFENVYDVPETSSHLIKSAANEWIAINFNDANHVIKMNTDEKIINKGLVKTSYTWTGNLVDLTVEFDMITEFKENRYKLTLNNITYKTRSMDPTPISWTPEPMTREDYKILLQSLIDDMPEGQGKRLNEKIISNSKKLEDQYNLVMNVRKKLYQAVVPEIEIIAGSLNNYIAKNTTKKEAW